MQAEFLVENLPSGYTALRYPGTRLVYRILSPASAEIIPTDRTIYEIDCEAFGGSFLSTLDRFLKYGGRKILLDLGGGEHSQSAHEIARRFGRNVKRIINIDLIADESYVSCDKVVPIQGDMTELERYVPEGSIDFVYSSFSTFQLRVGGSEHSKMFSGLARCMSDGGLGLLDEHPIRFEGYKANLDKDLLSDKRVSFYRSRSGFLAMTKGYEPSQTQVLKHLDLTLIPL